jgi:hypothetical protein
VGAILSASNPHRFLSVTKQGLAAIVTTKVFTFIVLSVFWVRVALDSPSNVCEVIEGPQLLMYFPRLPVQP